MEQSGKAFAETCGKSAESSIPIEQVAEMCHEANRVYCRLIGDVSQPPWEDAPDWQKESAIDGVKKFIAYRNLSRLPSGNTAIDQHNSWLTTKLKDGWRYGPVKDAAKKEHPCLLPYEYLPDEQKRKDILFIAVVEAFLKKV